MMMLNECEHRNVHALRCFEFERVGPARDHFKARATVDEKVLPFSGEATHYLMSTLVLCVPAAWAAARGAFSQICAVSRRTRPWP